ncbi:hypothetical protein [Ligilactobacillus agilis]|nr:hypothetical protein [Ligilactobacillus agilis]
MKLNDKWVCHDFDKTDGYIYFDDLAKELIPPELTLADKKGLESIWKEKLK